jgi:hypothetical protein
VKDIEKEEDEIFQTLSPEFGKEDFNPSKYVLEVYNATQYNTHQPATTRTNTQYTQHAAPRNNIATQRNKARTTSNNAHAVHPTLRNPHSRKFIFHSFPHTIN